MTHEEWLARRRELRKLRHEHFLEWERAWRDKHRERLRKVNREWKKANWERLQWHDKKKKYGITEETYKQLYKKQKGRCAICGSKGTKRWGNTCLDIDHSHDTKKVRGLLCNKCNQGLGCFADNQLLLAAAIKYLNWYDMEEVKA